MRHTRLGRLLIPALALVFALVTVWEALLTRAMALVDGGASEIAVHLHDDVTGASSVDHGENDDAPATDHSSDKAAHPCCADLTCHGGVAIFAAGVSTTAPQSDAVPFVITEHSSKGLDRVSLERPPRSFVQF